MTTWETLSVIGVVVACTVLTRALPFLVFKDAKKIPNIILYLGRVLPMAIMFCLVLYCIRSTTFLKYPYGIPEVVGILIVGILHVWKRNNIISIVGGTFCYMIMVQFIFL
ncbi:MAG: AzlD domain-containing protein [Longicatena sp.]